MLEPMLNAIPEDQGIRLSAFEMIASDRARQQINDLWQAHGEYRDALGEAVYTTDRTLFFNRSGPLKTTYRFSADRAVREKLMATGS